MRVVVVGAGVIGLTCAHRLVRAGHAVEVWSRDAIQDTTSAVAAAVWYPYRAFPEDAVTRWAGATYDMLSILSVRPETGVALVRGRELFREPRPDPWWMAAVPRLRRVTDLPPGYADGYEFAAPVVRMPAYLPWLLDELAAAGVSFRVTTVTDLAAVPADLVVNATGLGARELTGDTGLTGIRGQVVRVADPGLPGWVIDEDHPDGLVYVVPRGTDVVCGGTALEGEEGTAPDPAEAERILARCREVVPDLKDAPVLGHAVGVRPARAAVRLEREGGVVHCYGHGGAGVTLSWGCADEVVRLAG
ncbi:MAG TPA: FAD-dependent oxidoreductase [Mycobacteriales bacterium]|nr:FAD-dependent oxidoreductase [Mycobacteriales bacterium]